MRASESNADFREPGLIGRGTRSLVVGLVALAAVVLVLSATQSSYFVFILNSILLASMGAVALQVLMGTAGLISIGNAGFLIFGAYGSVLMLRVGVPFPLNVLAAVVLAGIAGAVTSMPALRLRGLYLALATLALHFIAVFFATVYQSSVPEARHAGFTVPILFGGSGPERSGMYWAWLLVVLLVLLIIASSRAMRWRSGRALRMIRDHEFVAPTLGIRVQRYKLATFTLTSMAIGLQGALFLYFSGTVGTANFTVLLAFSYVTMVVIGGLDSIPGAIIGAIVVIGLPVVVPEVIRPFVGKSTSLSLGADLSLIVYGVLVVIFVTASPDGIIGLARGIRDRAFSSGARSSEEPA